MYVFLHTLIVHWAIQSPIIARCTALLCVWCIVCFLVFLQRTLGNAVQCCVVSIWILCAILVLLAALIWHQILLVVFVFRKKASRISGNYVRLEEQVVRPTFVGSSHTDTRLDPYRLLCIFATLVLYLSSWYGYKV